MSEVRWRDIEGDVASSVEHFANAIRIYCEPGLRADSPDGYMRRMAFMRAMYLGDTSIERALPRMRGIMGEEKPSGRDRPVVLSACLVEAADRVHKFRHVAAHHYDTFHPDDADPAVRAAEKLVAGLPAAFAAYRQAIDP